MIYIPRYFKLSEFDQPGLPGSGEKFMDREFLRRLDFLRENVGGPLIVNPGGGWRSPEWDRARGRSGVGWHTKGQAADLAVDPATIHDVLWFVMNVPFYGVGINRKNGVPTGFIHVDDRPKEQRSVWSY